MDLLSVRAHTVYMCIYGQQVHAGKIKQSLVCCLLIHVAMPLVIITLLEAYKDVVFLEILNNLLFSEIAANERFTGTGIVYL